MKKKTVNHKKSLTEEFKESWDTIAEKLQTKLNKNDPPIHFELRDKGYNDYYGAEGKTVPFEISTTVEYDNGEEVDFTIWGDLSNNIEHDSALGKSYRQINIIFRYSDCGEPRDDHGTWETITDGYPPYYEGDIVKICKSIDEIADTLIDLMKKFESDAKWFVDNEEDFDESLKVNESKKLKEDSNYKAKVQQAMENERKNLTETLQEFDVITIEVDEDYCKIDEDGSLITDKRNTLLYKEFKIDGKASVVDEAENLFKELCKKYDVTPQNNFAIKSYEERRELAKEGKPSYSVGIFMVTYGGHILDFNRDRLKDAYAN